MTQITQKRIPGWMSAAKWIFSRSGEAKGGDEFCLSHFIYEILAPMLLPLEKDFSNVDLPSPPLPVPSLLQITLASEENYTARPGRCNCRGVGCARTLQSLQVADRPGWRRDDCDC